MSREKTWYCCYLASFSLVPNSVLLDQGLHRSLAVQCPQVCCGFWSWCGNMASQCQLSHWLLRSLVDSSVQGRLAPQRTNIHSKTVLGTIRKTELTFPLLFLPLSDKFSNQSVHATQYSGYFTYWKHSLSLTNSTLHTEECTFKHESCEITAHMLHQNVLKIGMHRFPVWQTNSLKITMAAHIGLHHLYLQKSLKEEMKKTLQGMHPHHWNSFTGLGYCCSSWMLLPETPI